MKLLKLLIIFLFPVALWAQDSTSVLFDEDLELNYARPKKYVVGGVSFTGVKYFDERVLRILSGFYEGQKITLPGDEVTNAIQNLWKPKYFSNIRIMLHAMHEDTVFISIALEEKPRLDFFRIVGLSKHQSKNLREALSLQAGQIVNDNVLQRTQNEFAKHFREKGYYDARLKIEEEPDTSGKNLVRLKLTVAKGSRIKVNDIVFAGNTNVKSSKLRRLFKETKRMAWWRFFKRSKFIEATYQDEKQAIVGYYNSLGYRDAELIKDTVYYNDKKTLNIQITVNEGRKYYFRDIKWVGNTKYTSDTLSRFLNIKRGEVYNLAKLEYNLFSSPNSTDISSLYMDDGYLFFQVVPVEIKVDNDSIDLEIRMTEGPQAIVNSVTVTGNTKTSDYVILRELRTKPGQKFSRSDIQRSLRDLSQMGYFDPEKLDVQPKPNPASGTVDIEYKLEEKSSDQVELSGGFGNGFVVGTLGLNLTNFSTRKMFKKGGWSPIPSGDGQRLSIRAQSNGTYYQSYNFSFTEPWFGGKRPNSLTFSAFHSIQKSSAADGSVPTLKISGATIALGKRLKWPDDWFTASYSINYSNYLLSNYSYLFSYSNGVSDNINLKIALSRNSTDDYIFPKTGSTFNFSVQATPPISAITGKDYKTATDQQKYRFIEYHKWKFDAMHYTSISKNLVLASMVRSGFMGFYNRDIGNPPFERFYVGGAGLIGFNIDGRELIALRGYKDNSVTPRNAAGTPIGATIYNKFTTELRYRISPNPQATVYLLTFLEAGNSWSSFKEYGTFNLLRSAGAGIRIFLPMFGLLGVDWGYGFDNNPYTPGSNKGNIHFFIGQQF